MAVRALETANDDDLLVRGSNQSGMRDHNQRLVLSLIRQHGGMAKAEIARLTGLSAQTTSVIMRELESEGLLGRGEPVRGKVGQPSIPMSLTARGAFFIGLKIGRRSTDLVVVDFLGEILQTHRAIYRYPTPNAVIAFVSSTLPTLLASFTQDERRRIAGLGVAMPFQLWNWVKSLNAPQVEMDAWRDFDIQQALTQLTDMPVFVQNDATSACGAELIFGKGERFKDFLYFYFGTFIGGGLVLNGQLYHGRTGNAGGVGPMPVPGKNAQPGRLFDHASLSVLADMMEAAGENSDPIWEFPDQWQVGAPTLDHWLNMAAEGLAYATLSATTLLELEAVVIDGWMPTSVRAELTLRTAAAFANLDLSGIIVPQICQGTIGTRARSLGAAAIPLRQKYLLETNTAARTS